MASADGKTLNIGFIGAGFIAQVAHLPAFECDPRVAKVGLADPRSEMRRIVSRKHDVAEVEHHDRLLDDPRVDAVVISVHRRCQGALARDALAAGKAVLSEKPMAYSVAEAGELVRMAAEKQLPYAIGFMKRHDPGVRAWRSTLAETIASGDLGEVVQVSVRDFCPTYGVPIPPHARTAEPGGYRYAQSPPGPEGLPEAFRADFDYSLNVLSHDLNLLRFLFGGSFEIEHFSVRAGLVQTALLSTPRFEVVVTAGRSNDGTWDQAVEVLFQRGRHLLRLPSPLARQAIAVAEMHDPRHVVRQTVPHDARWAFRAQAEHFVDACLGEGPIENAGHDGIEDLSLIEGLWGRVSWKQ